MTNSNHEAIDLTPQGTSGLLRSYTASLEQFIGQYDLPTDWFATADHVAVKCADAAHFEVTAQAWLPLARQASYVELNNRRLASFELREPLAVGSLGEVSWLEIMEPRPERAGSDYVGLEHSEFLFPEFADAERLLKAKGIPYVLQSNPNHSWLNIAINAAGQELKLNNRLLADTVATEEQEGRAKYFG